MKIVILILCLAMANASITDYFFGDHSNYTAQTRTNETDEETKMKGEACRNTCDTAQAYASGLCAGLSSFGAPLVCLALSATGVGCAVLQGVLWAFGGYCTSTAPARFCELCSGGISYVDLYERQMVINRRVVTVKNIFRDIEQAKESLKTWQVEWKGIREVMEIRARHETLFEDIDNILFLMSDLEFVLPGVPADTLSLVLFKRAVFAPGGGSAMYIGQGKSIFEANPMFCDGDFVRRLEHTQFSLFHAFFFAGDLNGFTQDEVVKFRDVFAKRREAEVAHIKKTCQAHKEALQLKKANETQVVAANMTTTTKNETRVPLTKLM